MNKFMFAIVAFAAIAANSVMAKPSQAYGAPVAASYGAPVSVSYQAIPASAVAPSYNAPSAAYSAPSIRAPASNLSPIAVQAGYGGVAAAPSVPSPLIAAASNPVAQSSANTQISGLAPGQYNQIAIPSYELLIGEKVFNQLNSNSKIGGYAAQIGAPATVSIIALAPAPSQAVYAAGPAAPALAYAAPAQGYAAPAVHAAY